MHKPTAGYTLIQLCEKVSPLSCTNWLLCPCRALDSCQGPWIALQLVSRWRGNRFLSPSFLCSRTMRLPERKMSRQGKRRRKNKPTKKKKHEIWRVRVKKSVWEKTDKRNDNHLSYFWKCMMWYRKKKTGNFAWFMHSQLQRKQHYSNVTSNTPNCRISLPVVNTLDASCFTHELGKIKSNQINKHLFVGEISFMWIWTFCVNSGIVLGG